jgi:hypothetical protein
MRRRRNVISKMRLIIERIGWSDVLNPVNVPAAI